MARAPSTQSVRETTLASLGKPGLPVTVLASPVAITSSSTPVVLTASVHSSIDADRVKVNWSLPAGVTLVSGVATQTIDHISAVTPVTVLISVTVADGATLPIFVSALFAHGGVTVGNGASISINTTPIRQKRVRFEATGDQRVFE